MSDDADIFDADALADGLTRYLFQIEMPSFNGYLETISGFLKAETKKHLKDIDDFKEQVKSGKIVFDDEPGQLTYEDHLNDLLNAIDEFENILLKSFFVTIYGFLESQLMQRCRNLRKENDNISLAVSDLRGEDVLDRAMKYLIKVQHIDFSFDQHPKEWGQIRNYGRLRNCIVHNEGRLDEGFEDRQRKPLAQFITQKDSGLHISGDYVVLTKEFCKNAWETIEEFLWLVSQAETRAKE